MRSGRPRAESFRAGLRASTRATYVVTEDDTGEQIDYLEWVDTIQAPLEALGGVGYVRIGSRWMADARLAYDGIIVPWDSGRAVLYSGLALTVGFGYRFGNL